jgi:AcrR family transcriptional regulator
MSRPRTSRRPDLRPEQILDAAEHLLASGPTEWSMDGVADRAGLAKGTLYHYYPSKSEVLDALRRRYLQRSVAEALAAAADGGPALARLERFLRTLLETAVAHGALVRALFHDSGISGNADLAIVSDALSDLIRAGVASGEFTVDNPDAVATFYSVGCFGVIQSAFDGQGVAPAAMAEELVGILAKLVGPVR